MNETILWIFAFSSTKSNGSIFNERAESHRTRFKGATNLVDRIINWHKITSNTEKQSLHRQNIHKNDDYDDNNICFCLRVNESNLKRLNEC